MHAGDLSAARADTKGVEVRVVKSRDGATPIESFAKLIDKRTRLVSVAWLNNNSGHRHDMKALAALAHNSGAYLHSDAVQFMGTGPVDLHAEGIDFCTFGTYKWLFAGFGVAVFYVRREHLGKITPANVGWRTPSGANRIAPRTTAKQLEYATLPFGDLYALDASLKLLRTIGLDKIKSGSQSLVERLRTGPDRTQDPARERAQHALLDREFRHHSESRRGDQDSRHREGEGQPSGSRPAGSSRGRRTNHARSRRRVVLQQRIGYRPHARNRRYAGEMRPDDTNLLTARIVARS